MPVYKNILSQIQINPRPLSVLDLIELLLQQATESDVDGAFKTTNSSSELYQTRNSLKEYIKGRAAILKTKNVGLFTKNQEFIQFLSDVFGRFRTSEDLADSWKLHALAGQLDEQYQSDLVELYMNRIIAEGGELRLVPGKIHVIPRYWKHGTIDEKFSSWTNPERKPHNDAGRLVNSRLVPESASQYELVCLSESYYCMGNYTDFKSSDSDEFSLNIAVAVANHQDHMNFATVLADAKPKGWFFGFSPDRPDQLNNIVACVDEAIEQRFDMLVFPEFIADESIYGEFLKDYLGRNRKIKLFVGGTRHAEIDEDKHNVASYVISSRDQRFVAEFDHKKMLPYDLTIQGSKLVEGIAHSNRIQIHLGRDWSLVVLICRDFIERETVRLMHDLGVSVVVVPAYSHKADSFYSNCKLLPGLGTTVVVANHPVLRGDEGVPQESEDGLPLIAESNQADDEYSVASCLSANAIIYSASHGLDPKFRLISTQQSLPVLVSNRDIGEGDLEIMPVKNASN